MELKDYWRVLRHRWHIIVACVLSGLLAASLATMAMPRTFEATSQLFVASDLGSTSSELMQGSDFLLDRVKSYVEIIDKAVILGPVIEGLGLEVPVGELSERVSATVVPDTIVLMITVEDESAEQAARVANAVTEEFVAAVPMLEPERADRSALVKITVVEPARVPLEPVAPQPVLNHLLGLLAGLALGLVGAIGREALDRRIKGEEGVKGVTDVPVMGAIPVDRTVVAQPVISARNTHGARAEALRQLRTNLHFLDVPQGRRSFVITSSVHGEGKTLTALNLAVTMASGGSRVCLVEADLRRPQGAHYLGLDGSVGLTDALIGTTEWSSVVHEYRPGLDVILAGTLPPNPSDLVASAAMEQLLHRLQSAYDYVLVDAPPLLPVTDAAVLSKRCAGAIVVVGCGRRAITGTELAHSLQMLTTIGARSLGVVLNKLPQKSTDTALPATYPAAPPASLPADGWRDGAEVTDAVNGSARRA